MCHSIIFETIFVGENEIVRALDNNEPVSFFVGKNHRRRVL